MSASPASIPAIMAPPPVVESPWRRFAKGGTGKAAVVGLVFLVGMILACTASLPWTLGSAEAGGGPRYDHQYRTARHLPPSWIGVDAGEVGDDTAAMRWEATARARAIERLAAAHDPPLSVDDAVAKGLTPTPEQIAQARPWYWMGTDLLGRDVLVRCLAGGVISLLVGIAAAGISVLLGTVYGAVSGYVGGRTDAVMMRIVDVLYGLPTLLLVVLLAVAVDALVDRTQAARAEQAEIQRADLMRQLLLDLPADRRDNPGVRESLEAQVMETVGTGEISGATRQAIGLLTLLVAIGGVSWLTMARVVRGQVLSLKHQPFMEAARAMGVPVGGRRGLFARHLLPNLMGPIIVYATLTVPQAILQESFLSFLGIGVKPPMPSWGNLAADGLVELNPFKSNWWLLVFPSLLLGLTLLALNFVGEGLREALDPKRRR
jgi:oligopeptide transport system permease protein